MKMFDDEWTKRAIQIINLKAENKALREALESGLESIKKAKKRDNSCPLCKTEPHHATFCWAGEAKDALEKGQ